MEQKNSTVKWFVIAAAGFGAIVIALSVLMRGGAGGEQGDAYKVGVLLPLTGDAAAYGEPGRNVLMLAASQINDAGGIDGKKIELVIEDAKCKGTDAASAMQKLVNIDKVQVVIGGFCSSESLAAAPVAESNKVALFSPGSSSPDLTNASAFFTRNYPSDASQGKVLAEIAYGKKNWRTVAFIQEQLDYPLGIFKAFSSRFEELGGTIIKEEFATGNTDFRSQLAKLKSQNPDALFVDTQTPAATERILKQTRDMQIALPILLVDVAIGDPKLVADNADILDGALGAEFGVDLGNPKYQALVALYKAKYASDVPYPSYAQTEYDAVFMVRDAIAAVGYDGTKIAQWLRSVKDWEGASARLRSEATGTE
jgi:branched-chain amino acid transport system substrate-binding protein